ncbi:MAG: WD40 repeat domain-containing protein, partial [Gemmataceae bacterium]
ALGVVCSPDGKSLFRLGDTIRAWNLATGEEQRSADAPLDDVLTVNFAADGKSLLILNGDRCLRCWDIARGGYVSSFLVRDVAAYRFTEDRRSLLTIDSNGSLTVRDPSSGRIIRRDRGGPPDSKRTWSRDGGFYAAIGEEGHIHLWDAIRGEELHRLEGHRGTVTSVRFSADGRWLFSVGADATLQWWDVHTGRRIERFQEEATNRVCHALSPDGRLLAWACGERIHLWDLAARKEVRVFRGHAFGTDRLALERDGTVVVSAGRDDFTIRCWDSITGQQFRAIQAHTANPYTSIFLFASPDGRVLSFAPMSRRSAEHAVHQPSTGIEICRTSSFPPFSADGKIVAVVGDKLLFREVLTGQVIATAPVAHRDGISWVACSSDGKCLLPSGRDSTTVLWDWRRRAGLNHEGT